MPFSTCPCCSNTLLRHIRAKGIYWFCCHCYAEMPNHDSILEKLDTAPNLSDYSRLIKVNKLTQKA